MKHTIMGFSQNGLKALDLDIVDVWLIRYFVDFVNSNSMKTLVKDGRIYYWVNYEAVIKELPILKVKKGAIQCRFLKLRDKGVLYHHVKKEGGTFSYFALGEKYLELISTTPYFEAKKKAEGSEEPSKDSQKELEARGEGDPMVLKGEGYSFKSITKDPSTKDPSIITPSAYETSPENIQDLEASAEGGELPSKKEACEGKEGADGVKIVSGANADENSSQGVESSVYRVVQYLNCATGKNFRENTKATVRLINARLREGFQVEDFEKVIDNMKIQWSGTRFQQYLAPATLFGTKFETYLNCKATTTERPKDTKQREEVNFELEEDM